ncbi:mechanosensitive ion channel [Rhodocytophaga rosea]|uniref:Mechanosensitive ion channel n=1 Tax=Rhodocytophaga rosea TaxID=2704465 RepID=A0A6C0GR90_9BACT|nr:mechanosensitive ion channel domain-containing protein [Rhodocytophaga rosea]QHT70123.1 mechanosensitive ion channel [Rhodocytophaga rosea]
MNLEEIAANFRAQWGQVGTIALLIIAIIVALIAHKVLFKFLENWSRRSEMYFGHLLNEYLYQPTRYILILLAIVIISPALGIELDHVIGHILTVLLIAAVANLCIRIIGMIREILVKNYDVKAENNLHARKMFTQFRIIERLAVFLIVIFAIAIALMTFEKIREVGVSLLASAGIVGIIVGFAAQKSLGTILAGIQIAIAQPIRIDDVVVIEGEWGRVEEIMLTYVVLKLWDERRLIVPINYFLEKPFQNWTRTSTELIGTVFLFTDYSTPVEKLREEFNRILNETPLWDKRTAALQVTNATEKTIEIRMIASASNSGNSFDLRCLIREKMIQFLKKNYPNSLPHTRMELNPVAENKTAESISDLSIQQARG